MGDFLLIEIEDKNWSSHRICDSEWPGSSNIPQSTEGVGFFTLEKPFGCGVVVQRYGGEAYFNFSVKQALVAEAVVVWDFSRWPELRGRIRRCFSHDPSRPTSFLELEQYLAGEIAILPSADWNRTLQLRHGMELPKTCPGEPFVVLMLKRMASRRLSSEQLEQLRKLVAKVAQKLLPRRSC